MAGLVLFLVPACLLLALIFGRPVAAGLAAAIAEAVRPAAA